MQKRLFAFALSTVFGVGIAAAAPQDAAPQDAPPPPTSDQAGPSDMARSGRGMMDPDRQVQMLSHRLNLSADQVSQIRPILADRISQMQALQGDTSLAQRDRRMKMRSIMQDADSRIKAVLNDDQRVQFQRMEQRRREQMRDRMQQGSAGAGNPDNANQ